MPDLKNSAARKFLEATLLERAALDRGQRPVIGRTEPFKSYPEAPKIPLPTDWPGTGKDFWSALQDRRSRRRFSALAPDPDTIARLLWACQGITGQGGRYYFRTAPSAGALYPIETYLAVNRAGELEPGLYHFNVGQFALERLQSGEFGPRLAAAAVGQSFLAEAGLVFIWSAIPRRTMSKYGDRGLRYLLLDAGHLCQNLLLAAEVMGLSACPVAAFFDREMNDLLGLDGLDESVLYLAAVGGYP